MISRLLKFFLVIGFFQAFISSAYSTINDVQPAASFAVEQFGAKADGVTDSTASFQNAINAAINFSRVNGKSAEVVLAAGTYHLACPSNAQGTPDVCLHIDHAQGITFRGQGLTATKISVSNPLMGLLSVSYSDEVSVKSFSLDYDPIPFAQGTIQSVDGTSVTIALDEGFPDFSLPVLGDPKYNKDEFGILFDPKSNPPTLKKNVPSWFKMEAFTQISKKPNVWKFQAPNAPGNFSVGDRLSYAARVMSGLTFWASSDILLKDVQMLSAPSAATIWSFISGQIEIDNFQVRRVAGRLISTTADALHMASITAKISIRNCIIEGMGDDALNIYHHGAKVMKILSATQFVFHTEGYLLYSIGQTLQIVDSTNKLRGKAKIIKYELDSATNIATVTLDQAIPGLQLDDFVFDYEMASPEAIVENNIFNSFRGIFRLRSNNSQFINNTISDSENAFLYLNSDSYFGEGPSLVPTDILVKGNTVQGGILKMESRGGVLTPPPASACEIKLAVCPISPTTVGTINDNYNGSGSNQNVCLQRATDFYQWCGIKSATDTVQAIYYVNGEIQKTVTVGGSTPTPAPIPTPVTGTRCEISLTSCPLYPSVSGTFNDDYNGASSNQAVCMQRATDFYQWCGVKSGSGIVKASYISNGEVLKTVTTGTVVTTPTPVTGTRCEITLASCPLHPTTIGTFADDYNGAGSNQGVCMQRATDFYQWCGIKTGSGQTSKADYILNGQIQKSITVGATVTTPVSTTSCQITLTSCPLHPTTVGTFTDNYNGASSNQTVCMQRAADFFNWCGIKSGSGPTSKADYLLNGQVQKTTTVSK